MPVKQPTCFFCHKLTSHFESCSSCRSASFLTGVIPAFYYNELAKRLIARFKYHDFAAVGSLMADFMLQALERVPRITSRIHQIVPVPLHFRRRSFRGYNQAEILARRISRVLHKPFSLSLKRVKATQAQAQLTRRERQQNLSGAFRWQGEPLMGNNIFLIDDVATSGETLNEAARELRGAGAREVWGIVFAKG